MDSSDKLEALISSMEHELMEEAQRGTGASPLTVLLAGALPLLKVSISEYPGGINELVDDTIALFAALRPDGAPPLAIAPGGTIGSPWLHELEIVSSDDGDALLALGEPLGAGARFPRVLDRANRLREINAGDVAPNPLPTAAGHHRSNGVQGD